MKIKEKSKKAVKRIAASAIARWLISERKKIWEYTKEKWEEGWEWVSGLLESI